MNAINNKVVFITGSSRGIGAATAHAFAKHGAIVVLTYLNDKKLAEQVADKCLQLGAADTLIVRLDVTQDKSISEAVWTIVNKFQQIDTLVNNAGVLDINPLAQLSNASIEKQIRTNLEGLIKITKACLPYIKESIVNIASNLGLVGRRNLTVYCATKFGVRGFTQALADERRDLKIFVVNPGLTATRMGSHKGHSPDLVADIILNASLGKYKVKRGGDINVHDYIHGHKFGYWLALARGLKRVLRSTINK